MRAFRFRDRKSDTKIDMTPMIDVVFQLLVFFMCTIQFRTLEGRLSAYLPKGVGPESDAAESLERVTLAIHVRASGTKLEPRGERPWNGQGPFRFGPDRSVVYQVGPREVQGQEALTERLRQLHSGMPQRGLTIDSRPTASGPGATYSDLIGALDCALAAGFEDIRFSRAR
jgi:biopolymer transport protein ExbD